MVKNVSSKPWWVNFSQQSRCWFKVGFGNEMVVRSSLFSRVSIKLHYSHFPEESRFEVFWSYWTGNYSLKFSGLMWIPKEMRLSEVSVCSYPQSYSQASLLEWKTLDCTFKLNWDNKCFVFSRCCFKPSGSTVGLVFHQPQSGSQTNCCTCSVLQVWIRMSIY